MKRTALDNFLDKLLKVISVFSVFVFFETLLYRGFLLNEAILLRNISLLINSLLVILYLLWVALKIFRNGWNLSEFLPDMTISLLLLGTAFSVRFGGIIISLRIFLILFSGFIKKTGISIFLRQIKLNPARIMLMTFLGLIAIGTFLLMLPAATNDQRGTDFIDAFFTSTSAACVTGLIVQDTATYFTTFGQLIILVLIQVGGLGIMTFSSVFAIFLGRRMGVRQEEQIREIFDQSKVVNVSMVVKQILAITILFELIGAVFLSVRWMPEFGIKGGIYHAVFHSVSAFCNAGFSTFSYSLLNYTGDYFVNFTVIGLIIFGGIGFMVINDLIVNMPNFNIFSLKLSRLEVHTKLVIMTTASLILIGTLAVFFFEFDNAMINLSIPDKLMASLFQSVTFRTAGFNTIDFGHLSNVTLFIAVLMMFVGASPSSTGGGIKTTTLAVMLLSVRSLLMSRDKVELFHRNITPQTVYKSVAIFLFSTTFIIIFTILLLLTQPFEFLDIIFEAVSAIGTVGLSTGITGSLDTVGKILITILMYVGRVGPLTVALALGEVKKSKLEYPTTRISVG